MSDKRSSDTESAVIGDIDNAVHELQKLSKKYEFLNDMPTIEIQNTLKEITDYILKEHEKGRKYLEDLSETGTITYLCDSIIEAKKDLPEVSDSMYECFVLFWNATHISVKICETFMLSKKVLKYVKTYLKGALTDNDRLNGDGTCSVLAIIYNCCRSSELCVKRARKAKFIPLLKKYLKKLNEKTILARMVTIATLAEILDEKEGEDILENYIEYLGMFIICLKEALESNTGAYLGWHIMETCRVIRRFASYDIYKEKLVELGALEPLVTVTKRPDDSKIESLKAIAHLAFNANCQKKMIEYEEGEVIETVMSLAESSETYAREIANRAIFTMKEQILKSKFAEKFEELYPKKVKSHVMISYSREQRQLLLDIRAFLEQNNFKVWMDVTEMRDHIYDRMAEGVEDASVVLLGMSRSYKMSDFCRSEAEYAKQLKKHIIPLKVEANYEPDGWLGLLTAGIYFYDFGKKPFDEMCKGLLSSLHQRPHTDNEATEVRAHGSLTTSVPVRTISQQTPPQIFILNKKMKNFRDIDRPSFEEWLEKNNLPREKFQELRPLDVLYLARMKFEAPDTYYSHGARLFKDKTKKFRRTQIMADLTNALDELFCDQ